MNREFLQDYEARERELLEKFQRSVLEGKFGSDQIYPPKERFVKICEPIAKAGVAPFGSIWPLIPLYGSLVVPIAPKPRETFAQAHGFGARDLDKLIDFCKDTGKVQFVLNTFPTDYEGLDYLDSLLVEIVPPMGGYLPFRR